MGTVRHELCRRCNRTGPHYGDERYCVACTPVNCRCVAVEVHVATCLYCGCTREGMGARNCDRCGAPAPPPPGPTPIHYDDGSSDPPRRRSTGSMTL